jgi:hypothetical protein
MKVGASHPPGICSFLQPQDRTREYDLVKEVGRSDRRSDRLVRIDSHRAIVHSQGLGEAGIRNQRGRLALRLEHKFL